MTDFLSDVSFLHLFFHNTNELTKDVLIYDMHCSNDCYKNEHFNWCLETMPSIPQNLKEEFRNKLGLKRPSQPIVGK